MARRGDGLYERGKGKMTTWYLDAVINGVRYQNDSGGASREPWPRSWPGLMRRQILKGDLGIGKKAKDLTFDEARKKFETWAAADKRSTTLRGYRQCLDRLMRTFGQKRLGDITPWTLEAYKRERTTGTQLTARPDGLSDAEWRRRCRREPSRCAHPGESELSVLKTLYNKCLEWGLYDGGNPVSKVKFRKEEKLRLRWLEPEEELGLLAALSSPTLRALVTVGINCGLRIKAEALTLQWASVDLKRGLLTVEAAYAKNRRTQAIPLNSIALGALKALKATATTDYVFTNENGLPYRTIRPMFRRACKQQHLGRDAARLTGTRSPRDW